jgi:hypothetical protein
VNELSGRVSNWYRTASGGAFPGWQVTAGGSFTVPAPKKLSAGACEGTRGEEIVREIWNNADGVAKTHGIDPSRYRVVAYVWDRHVCAFRGISDAVGGRRVALQTPMAAVHELGHILGLHHANLLSCTDANGAPVALSGKCTSVEYGDLYDSMALVGEGLFNAVYENALGWMNGQVVHLGAGDFSQTVTLKPLSEQSQSPRAVHLADGSTWLWIEYRQPSGLDLPQEPDGLTRGVLIHRELPDPAGGKPTSQLLDMSPAGSSFDSALPVGETWADPLGQMKITVNGETASGATVTISSQRVTVPDLEGRTRGQAESALRGLGLVVGQVTFERDPTCTHVNQVIAQTPAGGTRVFPGTVVAFSVGEKDTETLCQ